VRALHGAVPRGACGERRVQRDHRHRVPPLRRRDVQSGRRSGRRRGVCEVHVELRRGEGAPGSVRGGREGADLRRVPRGIRESAGGAEPVRGVHRELPCGRGALRVVLARHGPNVHALCGRHVQARAGCGGVRAVPRPVRARVRALRPLHLAHKSRVPSLPAWHVHSGPEGSAQRDVHAVPRVVRRGARASRELRQLHGSALPLVPGWALQNVRRTARVPRVRCDVPSRLRARRRVHGDDDSKLRAVRRGAPQARARQPQVLVLQRDVRPWGVHSECVRSSRCILHHAPPLSHTKVAWTRSPFLFFLPPFLPSAPCTSMQHAVCEPCPLGAFSLLGTEGQCRTCAANGCPPGQELVRHCTATQDNLCEPCRRGAFKSIQGVGLCERCSLECPAGYTVLAPCGATLDTQCAAAGSGALPPPPPSAQPAALRGRSNVTSLAPPRNAAPTQAAAARAPAPAAQRTALPPAPGAATPVTQVTLCPRAQYFDGATAACKECTRGCPPGEELVGLCGGTSGRSNAECMSCLAGFYKDAAMSAASPCATCGALEAPACGCVRF
jgi:hypothetical protein